MQLQHLVVEFGCRPGGFGEPVEVANVLPSLLDDSRMVFIPRPLVSAIMACGLSDSTLSRAAIHSPRLCGLVSTSTVGGVAPFAQGRDQMKPCDRRIDRHGRHSCFGWKRDNLADFGVDVFTDSVAPERSQFVPGNSHEAEAPATLASRKPDKGMRRPYRAIEAFLSSSACVLRVLPARRGSSPSEPGRGPGRLRHVAVGARKRHRRGGAGALDVNPNVQHRWRKEFQQRRTEGRIAERWRKIGQEALEADSLKACFEQAAICRTALSAQPEFRS